MPHIWTSLWFPKGLPHEIFQLQPRTYRTYYAMCIPHHDFSSSLSWRENEAPNSCWRPIFISVDYFLVALSNQPRKLAFLIIDVKGRPQSWVNRFISEKLRPKTRFQAIQHSNLDKLKVYVLWGISVLRRSSRWLAGSWTVFMCGSGDHILSG